MSNDFNKSRHSNLSILANKYKLYITNDTNNILLWASVICTREMEGGGGLANKDKRAPSILKVVQTVGWIFAVTNIKKCKIRGGGGGGLFLKF